MVGYLMYSRQMSFESALALARETRPFIEPNDGFAEQLIQFERDGFDVTKYE